MGILIKYTLRNIKEHKFRTFLIMLSIMLSVGLFFSSLSISDALTGMIMEDIKSSIGTAEININAGRFNDSGMIKVKDLGEYGSRVEYTVGVVESGTKFTTKDKKKENISLKGFRLEDLEIMNPVNFVESLGKDQFKGKAAIIGKSFAEKEGLKLNDFVKLEFSDNDIKPFRVVAIAEDKGFFKKAQGFGYSQTVIIAPRETLSRFNGAPGMVNVVYAKSANDKIVDQTIEDLKKVYKDENVNKMITKSEIDAQIKPIRIPFMFMLILVVMISMFIIYTSFKVITLERLPMLGTFRSIGATKKMTDTIMLSEAFIYGVLGSGFGLLIGHNLLKLVMKLISMGMGSSLITYPPENLMIAFTFGLVLSMVSALIPIVKTSRIPVKEILLNIIEGTKKKRPYIRYVFGVILVILSLVLPKILSEGMVAAVSGGLGIVLMIASLVCFIPFLSDTFIKVTEKIFGAIFGNVGLLAVKNMRGNKSTYDNIILLTIGIASVLTIMVMGSGMQKDTMSYFNSKKYDISVYAEGASKVTIQRILSIPGIENATSYQSVRNSFHYNGSEKDFLKGLTGVETEDFLDFFDYDILNHEDDEKVIKDLLVGRKLILGTTVRDEYGFKEGQVITLDTGVGFRDYEIIGFIKTKESNGVFGLTSKRTIKNDLKRRWGLKMAIKVMPDIEPTDIKSKIDKKLKNLDWYEVETLEAMKKKYMDENNKLIMILSAFSAATALIGSIGVMNNFLVSLLARRKSLAIYASVGMSKVQRKLMLLIEAISGGFIGAFFGIITAQLIMLRVTTLLGKIDVDLSLKITLMTGIIGFIGAIGICLLSSISVIRRLGKVSIIEELRYE